MMHSKITRRALLAVVPALAGAAWLRRASALDSPPMLSLDYLLSIGDDHPSQIDALSAWLWRSPSLADVLASTKLPAPRAYGAQFARTGFSPLEIPLPLDPVVAAQIDELSVLFLCSYVAGQGDFRPYVPPVKVTPRLQQETNTATTQRAVRLAYSALLDQTLPPRSEIAREGPGSTPYPFLAYRLRDVGDPTSVDTTIAQAWARQLAGRLTDGKFITTTLELYSAAPDQARRMLCVNLFKLGMLDDAQAGQVRSTWASLNADGIRKLVPLDDAQVARLLNEPEGGNQTVFTLATESPWPEVTYELLRNSLDNPVAPIMQDSLNTSFQRQVGCSCWSPSGQGTRTYPSNDCGQLEKQVGAVCHPHNSQYRGLIIWRTLKAKAAPLGVTSDFGWPKGL